MVDDPIEQRIRERLVQEQDGEAVADNAPVNTGCGNAADNATAEKRKPSAATLAAITVPAQAAPTRLPTIRWSYAFALRNTSTTLQVQYPEVAITGEPKTAPSCSRRRKR